MLISVVVTVKNEEEGMSSLLDSLLDQEKPFEIIVVDSNSSDDTPSIVKKYASKHDEIIFFPYDSTRGKSRNFGVKHAKGKVVAFTDGNCVADPNWIKEIRKNISKGYDIVAGKTIRKGSVGFTKLGRVELYHKDGDASFPTCNIAYRKDFFEKIGGFDPWFKEAEDVDLNYRALDRGAKMIYDKDMVIYHMGSVAFNSFIKKSFWYGFGRKELQIRHGSLWSNYNMLDMLRIRKGESFWKLIRLSVALIGYISCFFIGKKSSSKEKLRNSNFHKH